VRARRAAVLLFAAGLLVAVCARERAKDAERDDDRSARASRTDRRIDDQLAPASAPAVREGLAAAILIDVSGSMKGAVAGEDGRHEAKIDIARRAARDLVDQFARYADEHRDEPVLLGLYEFSRRNGEPDCRPILPMGPPDRARAESALDAVRPEGGTPIGDAMVAAKRELDTTGLTRRHLLVVTDGENTDGFPPDRVAAAIVRRPEAERPSIYFVAFDIEESKFAKVREAGGLVLAAANARELNDTLDSLLRGKILIEK
jgi:Ca-activated chloride channel family protein